MPPKSSACRGAQHSRHPNPTPPVVRSGFEGLSSSTTPPRPCVTARQSSPAPVSPAQPPPLTSQQSLLVAMFGRLSRHELCRVVLATWMHKARNMDALQCRAQSKYHKFDGSNPAAVSMVATIPSTLSPTRSASSATTAYRLRRSYWSPESFEAALRRLLGAGSLFSSLSPFT